MGGLDRAPEGALEHSVPSCLWEEGVGLCDLEPVAKVSRRRKERGISRLHSRAMPSPDLLLYIKKVLEPTHLIHTPGTTLPAPLTPGREGTVPEICDPRARSISCRPSQETL